MKNYNFNPDLCINVRGCRLILSQKQDEKMVFKCASNSHAHFLKKRLLRGSHEFGFCFNNWKERVKLARGLNMEDPQLIFQSKLTSVEAYWRERNRDRMNGITLENDEVLGIGYTWIVGYAGQPYIQLNYGQAHPVFPGDEEFASKIEAYQYIREEYPEWWKHHRNIISLIP